MNQELPRSSFSGFLCSFDRHPGTSSSDLFVEKEFSMRSRELELAVPMSSLSGLLLLQTRRHSHSQQIRVLLKLQEKAPKAIVDYTIIYIDSKLRKIYPYLYFDPTSLRSSLPLVTRRFARPFLLNSSSLLL